MDIESQDMVLGSIIEGAKFLIQELGAFAIGATVVGWVARDAITQYFDKKLSIYQAGVDKEVNRFQAELEKDKFRFSKLHDERAQITAELYERFVEFETDMKNLTDPVMFENSPSKEDRLKSARKSGNEFLNFYLKNKIYFPEDVCKTVEQLNEELQGVFHGWQILRPHEGRPGDPPDVEKWNEFWEKVTEDEVAQLKTDLEDHFRELLGVDTEEHSS